MPEGPEVKLFTEKLSHDFASKVVKRIEVISGRYSKKPIEDITELNNKTLKSVSCKGKFIWFDFDDIIIFNTLGMTGSWNRLKTKHSRIGIYFNDGDKLYFNDIRNFGTFQLKTRSELERKIKSIGPDMLSCPPSLADFVHLLRKKDNKNICDVLMNQKVISGVGNYIKAESLWYSRINPHVDVKDLTDDNLSTLWKAIRFVINKSYQEQGASIQSYYTFDGEEGSAVQGFVVYGRTKDYNGYEVIKETTPDKRTTHWVKERQTIGRHVV